MKESAKTDKFDKLREIYNSDGLPNTDVNSFKLPDLDIIMEAMPNILQTILMRMTIQINPLRV